MKPLEELNFFIGSKNEESFEQPVGNYGKRYSEQTDDWYNQKKVTHGRLLEGATRGVL